jgi:hypothetical protein
VSLVILQTTEAPATAAAATPNAGTTTFQTIKNPGDNRDGSMLMVEAYAVIWTILMIWLLTMWNKQRTINARLDELEGAIDRTESKLSKKGSV